MTVNSWKEFIYELRELICLWAGRPIRRSASHLLFSQCIYSASCTCGL